MCNTLISKRDSNNYQFLLALLLQDVRLQDKQSLKKKILSTNTSNVTLDDLLTIAIYSSYGTAFAHYKKTNNCDEHKHTKTTNLAAHIADKVKIQKPAKLTIDSNFIDDCNTEIIGETYGIAQKWVNMSMKYLYVLSRKFPLLHKYIDFNSCHCPIDSKILLQLYKNYNGTAWSQLDKVKYEKIVEEIAQQCQKKQRYAHCNTTLIIGDNNNYNAKEQQ